MNNMPIVVKQGSRARVVTGSAITYVESRGRLQIIHTKDGANRVLSRTMQELENTLNEGFYRIHRSFLVNMDFIDLYERTQVKLRDGSLLMMSKYKYQDFVSTYLEYMSNK